MWGVRRKFSCPLNASQVPGYWSSPSLATSAGKAALFQSARLSAISDHRALPGAVLPYAFGVSSRQSTTVVFRPAGTEQESTGQRPVNLCPNPGTPKECGLAHRGTKTLVKSRSSIWVNSIRDIADRQLPVAPSLPIGDHITLLNSGGSHVAPTFRVHPPDRGLVGAKRSSRGRPHRQQARLWNGDGH